jgi:hypothetical protein
MDAKEQVEIEILKAMSAIDKMVALVPNLPEDEGYDCAFLSNLIDMKSKLKYFLNNHFDRLARNRQLNNQES